MKSQKDGDFVETSASFGFLPPLLWHCSLDFNILLVLECSMAFGGTFHLSSVKAEASGGDTGPSLMVDDKNKYL